MISPLTSERLTAFTAQARLHGLTLGQQWVMYFLDQTGPLPPARLAIHVASSTRKWVSSHRITRGQASKAIDYLLSRRMLRLVDDTFLNEIILQLRKVRLELWTDDVLPNVGSLEFSRNGADIVQNIRNAAQGAQWQTQAVWRLADGRGAVLIVGCNPDRVAMDVNDVVRSEHVAFVSTTRMIQRWASRWFRLHKKGWIVRVQLIESGPVHVPSTL
jgi:hypothetical protein